MIGSPATRRSTAGGARSYRCGPDARPRRHHVPGAARGRSAAGALAAPAQRVLAAQIYSESNFNPFATSAAGAQGIAQFMPETARAIGLDDPFDAEQAIEAQARLMRDLLRRFAAVPLAHAAYNAGPRPLAACGGVPPYPQNPR